MYLHYFDNIISGLVEIHSRNHVHRDIKPGNVFIAIVRKNKQELKRIARLGDFGTVRVVDTKRESSLTKETGTPLYMSPE